MPDPDIKIKVTREGVAAAADDLKKLENASKNTGEQVEKLTSRKSKFVDAVKKAGREVPLLGQAISTLTNPFTALAALVALAASTVKDFVDEVNRLENAISGQSLPDKMQQLGKLMGESKAITKTHADEMKRLAGEVETVEKMVERLNRQLSQRLKLEADIAKATGQDTLGADRTRQLRELGGRINNAAQGFFRARDVVREGEAQFPAELSAFEAAKKRRDDLLNLADSNTISREKIERTQDDLAKIEEAINNPGGWQNFLAGFRFNSPEEIIQYRDSLASSLEGFNARNRNAANLRESANADFGIAQGRFDRFRAGITTARQQMNQFGAERNALEGEFNATGQAFGVMGAADGGMPGRIGPAFSTSAQRAFEEGMANLAKSIERMFSATQQRVDQLSVEAERRRVQAWLDSQNVH